MKKKMICIGLILFIIAMAIFIIFTIKNKYSKFNYQIEKIDRIDYMLYSDNNKFGVIDKNGSIIINALYDEIQIPNPTKPLFICMYGYDAEKQQYNIKVFNDKQEQILYQYVTVEAIKLNSGISSIPYEKSVLKYKNNGKYGLIDFNGKIILKAQYDEINSFDYNEGLLLVKKEEKYGLININGASIIDAKYDTIDSDGYYEEGSEYRKSGYIVGEKEDNGYLYGYISSKRKQILDVKYEQIDRIKNIEKNDDIFLVAFQNGKAGLYKNDKNIIKHEYEDIGYDENNNCLILQQDSKQGLSDFDGNRIIDIKYDNIYISGKYINAQIDNNIEIYDYETKQKLSYENIIGINQTNSDKYSIAITNEEKYKIILNETNELKTEEYEYLEYVFGDCFIISKNSKYGVIDINNNIIIDFKYDNIKKIPNSELLQCYKSKEDKVDIIAYDKLIITMSNPEIYLEENYIKLNSDSQQIYIDYTGKILSNLEIYNKELYAFEQQGKWGYIDKNENIVISPIYDYVTEFNEYNFAGVKTDGKWGVININGEEIIEPTYIIDSFNPNFVGKFYEVDNGYGEPYYISNNIK